MRGCGMKLDQLLADAFTWTAESIDLGEADADSRQRREALGAERKRIIREAQNQGVEITDKEFEAVVQALASKVVALKKGPLVPPASGSLDPKTACYPDTGWPGTFIGGFAWTCGFLVAGAAIWVILAVVTHWAHLKG